MNAQHTPGPWDWSENCASRKDDEIVCINVNSPAAFPSAIAYMQSCDFSPVSADVCVANARLIAASPELLYAAESAVDAFDTGCVDAQTIGLLRAAIAKAKATGETA